MPDAALFHPLLLAFVVPPNLSASAMLNRKPLLLKDTAPARSIVAFSFLLDLKFERFPWPPAEPKAFTLGTYGGDIQESFGRFSLEEGPARTLEPPF